MVKNNRTKVVIMGAAGRDFHNFNTVYRDDTNHEVLAFTATQIPGIDARVYPASLSGPLYPHGIPIISEKELKEFCQSQLVTQVIFAYSDMPHIEVMHRASTALATGADFLLLGPHRTSLAASVPVIAVSAVRTGCGKSQTCRWLATQLKNRGLKVAAIRHPMPYGDLNNQQVQQFSCRADLNRANCTIEEREEYEPYIDGGVAVYAGVDYERIVTLAEREADIILWDGGNNDFPFVKPDLHIVLVDPLRAGDETRYYPGEAVLGMADVVVIPKVNAAGLHDIENVIQSVRSVNPRANVVKARSVVQLEEPGAVANRRVLVIEDGPTTTHGGMGFGAGYVAAVEAAASEIVDPRPGAAPGIQAVFAQYPHLERVLPAVGYFPEQLADLESSINATEADVVVAATPCDLARLINCNKPIVRARYEYAEAEDPGLVAVLEAFLDKYTRQNDASRKRE